MAIARVSVMVAHGATGRRPGWLHWPAPAQLRRLQNAHSRERRDVPCAGGHRREHLRSKIRRLSPSDPLGTPCLNRYISAHTFSAHHRSLTSSALLLPNVLADYLIVTVSHVSH